MSVVIGEALRLQYKLAELAKRHRIPAPKSEPATLPLLPVVAHDWVVEGLATTTDVDQCRMKFHGWCFPFLPWEKKPPLRYRHGNEDAAEILDLSYDQKGQLRVRARVTHSLAKRCSAPLKSASSRSAPARCA